MKCTNCVAANAPQSGTPAPGYCDACGWAITDKGALMAVSPMAIGVVAAGNAAAAYQRGTNREGEIQEKALRGLAEEIARRAKR